MEENNKPKYLPLKLDDELRAQILTDIERIYKADFKVETLTSWITDAIVRKLRINQ